MKTLLSKQSSERANTLVSALIIGVVMLIILGSYMTLLGTQKNMVNHSQSWNAALTMAEAGVEEALEQLSSSSNNFSANGWTPQSGNVYGPVTRTMLGGKYTVSLSGSGSPMTISSTGFATVTVSGDTVSRVLKVTAIQQGTVYTLVGIGARGSINFNGNGVAADSWNSHNTNYSTNGHYDSTKANTNGSVASVGGLVDIGNHTINGSLYLGPTATYAGGGTVTGTIYDDWNVQFQDVKLPTDAATWPSAAPTTVTTVNGNKTTTTTVYDFTTSGNYVMSSGNYPIVVEPGVTVNLNVTATTFAPSSVQIHGGSTNSGTAMLYMNGPTSISMAGNTAVDASNRPENLWYFGLPSVTSITFSGTSDFVGVIYAPEASLTLNGGGNGFGVMGSVVVNNITMNGHYDFHYDESLASPGSTNATPYVVGSWQEIY